jgi:thiol-disulfide isomerase/thioredoxin
VKVSISRVVAVRASFVLLFFCASCFAAAKIGEIAPDVPLGTTSAGDSVKVSDYAGKVVVVSFWASWCAPCRKELPILEGLQQEGKGNIQVIAVNIDSRDVFGKAAKLLGELHLILANDRGDRGQRAYAVKAIPHMVIIGRDGRILDIHSGYGEASLDEIVDEINRALGVHPSAATQAG